MRLALQEFLQKLGVNHVLSPYETQPWLHYDEAQGITCSAEVRMGPGGDDIEAEIQFFKDDGDETEGGEETGGTGTAGSSDSGGEDVDIVASIKPGERKQIMRMRAIPQGGEKQWGPADLLVNGKNYVNEIHDWEEKGCAFFRGCIQSIQMGELPDVNELIKQELDDDVWGGRSSGKIGRKSPKIKPAQLLGMKKGMGP